MFSPRIWGLAQTKQAQFTKKSGAILREELRRINSIALINWLYGELLVS